MGVARKREVLEMNFPWEFNNIWGTSNKQRTCVFPSENPAGGGPKTAKNPLRGQKKKTPGQEEERKARAAPGGSLPRIKEDRGQGGAQTSYSLYLPDFLFFLLSLLITEENRSEI